MCVRTIWAIANRSAKAFPNCEWITGRAPGVYFEQKGQTLVVLLCGGDQRTQDRDIRLAKQYWHEFKVSEL